MQEFQVGVLSDSRGRMSARETESWRSEERRMRYLLETMYLGPLTRAGVMSKVERRMRAGVTSKERSERICWILGDVILTEFDNPS